MYNSSKDKKSMDIISHDINYGSRGKMKMKTKLSVLTKLHTSSYYRGCMLWNQDQLPEDVQKSENIMLFKSKVKDFVK